MGTQPRTLKKIKFVPHHSFPLAALPFDSPLRGVLFCFSVFLFYFFKTFTYIFFKPDKSKFGELGPNLENRHGLGGSVLYLKLTTELV